MITQHDPADRKLKRVKISLMRDTRFAFWRGVMMVGKTELSDHFPTAATDGQNEIYGRKLVEMLNEKMLAFVILHENLHKIERHLTTWNKMFETDPELTNKACDYHINLLLHDMDPLEQTIAFPRTPDGKRYGLLDERFRGKSIPEIFRILKQEKQAGGGGGSAPKQPGGGKPSDGDGDSDSFDEHQWGEAKARTAEQQDALDKDIDQALRQGEMEHRKVNGDKAGDMERHLSDLLKPKIDWRTVLADFVRSTASGRDKSTWRRPNRRFIGQDIIMPSMISERVGRIAVGIDTSGSIGGPALTAFLSEVLAIATEVRPEKLDLLYWDARVAGHETYDETNLDLLATSTKPKGGGGTNVNCVFDYIKKEMPLDPECCVILTDGYTPWPTQAPDYPVLWVITTKTITAPFGVTVHMNETN